MHLQNKKKSIIKILTMGLIIICLLSVLPALSYEKATKEECVEKAKEAAQMVKTKGIEETIKAINDKKGPFVWKDSYVFCVNIVTQQIAAHPFQHDIIGMQIENISDEKGKIFFTELVGSLKYSVDKKGEGWIRYRWKTPDGKKTAIKLTFIYKVPGYQYVMGAGILEKIK